MRLALFLLTLLLAAPAFAAWPLTEADYLKSQEQAFAAGDRNGNNMLDASEMAGAVNNDPLMPSGETKHICESSGRSMAAGYTGPVSAPGTDKEPKTLNRADFLKSKQSFFEHCDGNHDKSVTADEKQACERQMAEMCKAAPAMMEQAKAMQGIAMNPNLTPEQMRARMIERMKNMKPPSGMKNVPQVPVEGGE